MLDCVPCYPYADKGKLCCIAVLFIVVIALFIALIYG